MIKEHIDHGNAFDWGKASEDYARYRDCYPEPFYARIIGLGLCKAGQNVLDLGTGTGVLPRALSRHGAAFTGVDISSEQIAQARRLSEEAGLSIEYRVCPAEEIDFADDTFDVVTACQCLLYFDKAVLLPKLRRMIKPGGRLAQLSMFWLPEESKIARASEELVLRYSPQWTGAGFVRFPVDEGDWAVAHGFRVEHRIAFDLEVPFTRESWNGRMKACRGVGASLPPEHVARFEEEHLQLLEQTAPAEFTIPHYAHMLVVCNDR